MVRSHRFNWRSGTIDLKKSRSDDYGIACRDWQLHRVVSGMEDLRADCSIPPIHTPAFIDDMSLAFTKGATVGISCVHIGKLFLTW